MLSDKDRIALNEQLTTRQRRSAAGRIDLGRLVSFAHPQRDHADRIGSGDLFDFFPGAVAGDAGDPARPRRQHARRIFRARSRRDGARAIAAIWNSIFRTGWRACWTALGNALRRARRAGHERRPASVPRAESALREPSPREILPSYSRGSRPEVPAAADSLAARWTWLAAWAVGGAWWPRSSAFAIGCHFHPRSPSRWSSPSATDNCRSSGITRAKPVAKATRGSLMIVDGGESRTLSLSRQELATGNFTYSAKDGRHRGSDDGEDAGGGTVQEASRFLGQPPAASVTRSDPAELEQHRSELDAEVRRLRQANGAQAARIQQLERTLQILRTRLGAAEKP